MKENIDDIYADITTQYGNSQLHDNIAYVMNLYKERLKEDGTIDDSIPVPSVEAAMKAVILMVERPEILWKTICQERRMKHVMEYLFIRAKDHPEEVHEFIKKILKEYSSCYTRNQYLSCLDIWNFMCKNERPSEFVKRLIYPDRAEEILRVLHLLISDEVGRGAALVMTCAREEGLIDKIPYNIVQTEFPHIQKNAYNNYVSGLRGTFDKSEKTPIIIALRTKIGYSKNEDGSLTFKELPMTEKNIFYHLFRILGLRK